MPCVRAGLLSHCLETPAWIRAQGSHHALPRSGGEPASTALGGGRSSLSVAVSRKSIAHIRDPHPERQKLRAALCLPRRAAEREGCLQTEVGPLDSGGRRLGVPVARRAMPPGGEGSGKAMSTMVVQERHLWLNLAEMKDVDKARFLDAPISQGGLFGDTVEGFAQQFSVVQQQTEAIQHILPRRDAPSTAAPGARPQSARRRGRPPASSRAAPPQAESTHRPVRRATRRRAAPPASQPGPESSRKSTKRP